MKYKLQINEIKKYARRFWGNEIGKIDENSQSYIDYMTNDTSQLHENICDALVIGTHWGNNCSIPKDDLSIIEVDVNGNEIKTYSYQEVWDLLPKKNVTSKSEIQKVTRKGIFKKLEPIVDVSTGQVICNTNFINITYMMHIDFIESFLNSNDFDFTFETPIYLLEKVDNKIAGVLNKYFDEHE